MAYSINSLFFLSVSYGYFLVILLMNSCLSIVRGSSLGFLAFGCLVVGSDAALDLIDEPIILYRDKKLIIEIYGLAMNQQKLCLLFRR